MVYYNILGIFIIRGLGGLLLGGGDYNAFSAFFNDPTAGAGGAAFADSVAALAAVRDTANNNIINNISPPAAT